MRHDPQLRLAGPALGPRRVRAGLLLAALLAFVVPIAAPSVLAHGVEEGDAAFIQGGDGARPGAFLYLGAKHMVTGYDHLLFLVGVIFFLFRMKDVLLYASLFTLGHSITLLLGVLGGIRMDSFLIDAVIGLSVVYKGLDNLGAFKRWFGRQPDTRAAVLVFGMVHGFGLATKLQDFVIGSEGLVANILAFNVGVEIGQFLALGLILVVMGYWRLHPSYMRHATITNFVLVGLGFLLFGFQISGYFLA